VKETRVPEVAEHFKKSSFCDTKDVSQMTDQRRANGAAYGPRAEGDLAAFADLFLERLDRLEARLDEIAGLRTVKEWYTVPEVARLLDRKKFTVREWCRLGRVHAQKRECGRGPAGEWVIPHAELERIRNEGLLPERR
jgi:hypothetical protein